MTETPAAYRVKHEPRQKAEALALRHVLTLAPEDRPDAARKLDAATFALVGLVGAVSRKLDTQPALLLPDVGAMLKRPELQEDLKLLEGFEDILDPSTGQDPDALLEAYKWTLEDAKRNKEGRRLDSAAALVKRAQDAKTEKDRRRLVLEASHELARTEQDTEGTLAEVWEEHKKRRTGERVETHEALTLDARRGPWAEWTNRNLGPHAGLEAGQTFVLAGAPEAGKTSLAALFAVDALAAGCPVLFWQLELGREETLEHLVAQSPDMNQNGKPHWQTRFYERWEKPLPASWGGLLTVPRWPSYEAEEIKNAMLAQARRAERERNAGRLNHKVNGLVVVDYMQLLTMAASGPQKAGHEVLASAASLLAKAAAESGACLLLLSQLNKQEQREGVQHGTALAGADLARMAHRVAMLTKATSEGRPCGAADEVDTDPAKGEARLLRWTKRRGVYREPPDYATPDAGRVIWCNGASRAFHGGETASQTQKDWGL
jgi:KaiC/GvpD/RAD55 family RecA-like ATPase